MKTLDEVIAEIEEFCICPSSDEYCVLNDVYKDALHYLKEYRSDRIQWEADRKNWQDQYAQAVENFKSATAKHLAALKEIKGINDPLTWSELKQMEGKPVWVEYDDHFPGRKGTKFKEWEVISCIFDDRLIAKGEWDYHKNEIGQTWQAYRKENV